MKDTSYIEKYRMHLIRRSQYQTPNLLVSYYVKCVNRIYTVYHILYRLKRIGLCGSNRVTIDVVKKGVWFMVTRCYTCHVEMIQRRLNRTEVIELENHIRTR